MAFSCLVDALSNWCVCNWVVLVPLVLFDVFVGWRLVFKYRLGWLDALWLFSWSQTLLWTIAVTAFYFFIQIFLFESLHKCHIIIFFLQFLYVIFLFFLNIHCIFSQYSRFFLFFFLFFPLLESLFSWFRSTLLGNALEGTVQEWSTRLLFVYLLRSCWQLFCTAHLL